MSKFRDLGEFLIEETQAESASYDRNLRLDLGSNGYRVRKAPTMDGGDYADLLEQLMEGNQ